MTPIKLIFPHKIIIHHSASPRDTTTLQMVDAWHEKRWPDFKSLLGYWVGYHFLITADGVVHQTRNIDEEGAHTFGYNSCSIGICLTGNFQDEIPTSEQLKSLAQLIAKYNLPVYGHRDFSATACPGNNLYHKWNKKMQQTYSVKGRSEMFWKDADGGYHYIPSMDQLNLYQRQEWITQDVIELDDLPAFGI